MLSNHTPLRENDLHSILLANQLLKGHQRQLTDLATYPSILRLHQVDTVIQSMPSRGQLNDDDL